MSRNRRHLEDGEIEERDADKRSRRSDEPPPKKNKADAQEVNIATKTGGAYIPPARLRMMQQQITDKSSEQYQRISWEALKKSINGLINKVNTSNISLIVRELFQENIVRGRGVLAQSILQAQNASPTFTKVYAALVAIINTRFPQNGELILRRLALQFRRSYRRNRKEICLHSSQFIAHLINQQVAHEIIGLQILTLLLENPTEDSVEVAVGFLKESGQKLMEVSPRGLAAIMERLRTILHEQELDKRVQYMIEVMFAIRKDGFKEHPSVTEDLDLVEEADQFTHMLQLDDDGGGKGMENELNVFHADPDFIQNEENYKQIKKDILDEGSEGSSGSDSDSSSESSEEEEKDEEKTQEIEDRTETNLVALRRTIYLAIQSSLDFEECAHKLLKMEFDVKDYREICAMIIDCCSQQRTYEKFFGLLGARFCILKKEFMEHFEVLFAEQYDTIHRLETSKLRNVAKFFGHLLHSDALPWTVLQHIALSEDTTTSSSRIFIKILFQELVEYLGLPKLNKRLKDETLAPFFEGLFPKDNPKNTRFAINFFTSIGLGGITDELREHLKNAALEMTKKMQAQQLESLNIESDSDSETSSSEEEKKKKKKSKKTKSKKESTKKKKKKLKKRKKSSSSNSDDQKRDSKREEGWETESESSPERRMKSKVHVGRPQKKQDACQKSRSPEQRKPRKEEKSRNGRERRDKEERRSHKQRNRSSSSDGEAERKRNNLRDRLLTFSNTVPNEHFSKNKRIEKPEKNDVISKKSKDKMRNGKHSKRKDSSSSSSSSSDSSSSNDSESEEEDPTPPRGRKPRAREEKKQVVPSSDDSSSEEERREQKLRKRRSPVPDRREDRRQRSGYHDDHRKHRDDRIPRSRRRSRSTGR